MVVVGYFEQSSPLACIDKISIDIGVRKPHSFAIGSASNWPLGGAIPWEFHAEVSSD